MTHESLRSTYKRSRLHSLITLSKVLRSLSPVLAIVLWCGSAGAQEESVAISEALKVAKVSAPLTNDEMSTAVRLAEEGLKSARLFTERKLFLTGVHISRNTALEMKGVFERRVILTYYRYEGDLSIRILIDLTRRRVLEVKPLSHSYAPISTEESELAKKLALNDPRLNAVLRPYGDRLIVEVLTLWTTLPKDPLFRHRVVYLLFRSGSTYLMRQSRVLVDLTTEKVIIEPLSVRSSI